MNRLLVVILLIVSVSFSSASHAGGATPLCPPTSLPNCVWSNWGQTEPEGVDSSMAPHRGDVAAAGPISGSHVAVQLLSVAARPSDDKQQPAGPLKTVISPIDLFPRETAALTSAIRHARFNPDGSIARGEERIAAAAAAAARAAGTRYTLTLYIKVPQRLKPDESGLLGKKVQTINDVLMKSADAVTTGRPQS